MLQQVICNSIVIIYWHLSSSSFCLYCFICDRAEEPASMYLPHFANDFSRYTYASEENGCIQSRASDQSKKSQKQTDKEKSYCTLFITIFYFFSIYLQFYFAIHLEFRSYLLVWSPNAIADHWWHLFHLQDI